ncbi:hypothetical protein EGI32_09505 [Ferruginibacter sp. HRS2-29]|nr:hypothetical protein [Ferruginibacter sp. HRS2-29]
MVTNTGAITTKNGMSFEGWLEVLLQCWFLGSGSISKGSGANSLFFGAKFTLFFIDKQYVWTYKIIINHGNH